MPKVVISESRMIHASAGRVYATLADYREGHPRILPERYFANFAVEAGGVGAGTVIGFEMRVLGRRQRFRATVSEPEPGRILMEVNDSGAETTFTVVPTEDDASCDVTIATSMDVRRGLMGRVAASLASRMLRPIYREELELLEGVVTPNTTGAQ